MRTELTASLERWEAECSGATRNPFHLDIGEGKQQVRQFLCHNIVVTAKALTLWHDHCCRPFLGVQLVSGANSALPSMHLDLATKKATRKKKWGTRCHDAKRKQDEDIVRLESEAASWKELGERQEIGLARARLESLNANMLQSQVQGFMIAEQLRKINVVDLVN